MDEEPHTLTPNRFEKWLISFETPEEAKCRNASEVSSPLCTLQTPKMMMPSIMLDEDEFDDLSINASTDDPLNIYGEEDQDPSLASFNDSLLNSSVANGSSLDDQSSFNMTSDSPATPVTATPLLRQKRTAAPMALSRTPLSFGISLYRNDTKPQENASIDYSDIHTDGVLTPPTPVLKTTRLYSTTTKSNLVSSTPSAPTTTPTILSSRLTTSSKPSTVSTFVKENKEETKATNAAPKTPLVMKTPHHWTTPFKPCDFHQLASPSLTSGFLYAHHQIDCHSPSDSLSEDSPVPPCLVTTRLSTTSDFLFKPNPSLH